ncbi:MAG TPA: response regulator [Candidatus Angelobacter sp.]|nr:response regulator [Candidatus Angelobacter sp.]
MMQDGRRKPVVMIVDDEPVIRETILEILNDEGFEAIGMSSATQALAWVERIRPDVILTDVVMPGTSGIELAASVAEKYPECRVVLFSGQSAATDMVERARAQGHDFDLLPKPLDPEVLLSTLRSLARREP